jgi:hypothetical protein
MTTALLRFAQVVGYLRGTSERRVVPRDTPPGTTRRRRQGVRRGRGSDTELGYWPRLRSIQLYGSRRVKSGGRKLRATSGGSCPRLQLLEGVAELRAERLLGVAVPLPLVGDEVREKRHSVDGRSTAKRRIDRLVAAQGGVHGLEVHNRIGDILAL